MKIILMRYVLLLPLLLTSLVFAQSTQPTTQPIKADRSTVIGTCMLYDQTIADLGIDKGADFYHCKTAFQRRFVRADLEKYVAINKLVRLVKGKLGEEAGKEVRRMCRDSEDYSDVIVNEDGDAAALQRGSESNQPIPFIRIDGKWCFSMPDWEDMVGRDQLLAERILNETRADLYNETIADFEAGKIKTAAEIEEKLLSGQ